VGAGYRLIGAGTRTVDGHEVPLTSYTYFAVDDMLTQAVMERMRAGVATRRPLASPSRVQVRPARFATVRDRARSPRAPITSDGNRHGVQADRGLTVAPARSERAASGRAGTRRRNI
jgi:hypothetical protein